MATDPNHHKRPRTAVTDSSDIDMDSVDDQTPNKALRSNDVPSSPFACRLPPTCSHRPTQLNSAAEMEQHYSKYHAHVCIAPKCGCVFHEARLLELHQTECHDPIAAVRRDRGEKIFACFQPTCDRVFLTPKARRRHLVDAHGYNKNFFFAVTLKGIGGLLAEWGEGASLIRDEWKPKGGSPEEGKSKETNSVAPAKESAISHEEAETTRASSTIAGVAKNQSREKRHPSKGGDPPTKIDSMQDDTQMNVDQLADSMSGLSLIPPAIRFGRGGKRSFGGIGTAGGFVRGVHHEEGPTTRGSAPNGRGHHPTPGRGRVLGSSARGTSRGRGRIVPPA